jgi:hypothetical protein
MKEKVRRLNPHLHTLRRLFLLSRNLCAFDECTNLIIDEYGNLLAEVCHIEAANETGERFNPNQSNEERRQFENLILLCRHHHAVTNDVSRFSVQAMKEMKAAHEAKALPGGTTEPTLERFIDQSLSISLQLPQNFQQLDLSNLNPSFFTDAVHLIRVIASLPSLTRSFYAHAFAYSHSLDWDISIYCDPSELQQRLRHPATEFMPHFAILERFGLMWIPEYRDDWSDPPMIGSRSYFRQFDKEDNGIYFLWMIRRSFSSDPAKLIDIVENLNFHLLDA